MRTFTPRFVGNRFMPFRACYRKARIVVPSRLRLVDVSWFAQDRILHGSPKISSKKAEGFSKSPSIFAGYVSLLAPPVFLYGFEMKHRKVCMIIPCCYIEVERRREEVFRSFAAQNQGMTLLLIDMTSAMTTRTLSWVGSMHPRSTEKSRLLVRRSGVLCIRGFQPSGMLGCRPVQTDRSY